MDFRRLRETMPKRKQRSPHYWRHKKWKRKVKEYLKSKQKESNYNYTKKLSTIYNFSQSNLKEPTQAEVKFESILKSFNIPYLRQPYLVKYKYSYIFDFVLEHPYYLVIEIDGEYHNISKQKKYDKERDGLVGQNGYETLRFTNREVFEEPKKVRNKLSFIMKKRYQWNKNCKFQKLFWGGESRVIKPNKPIDSLCESKLAKDNP